MTACRKPVISERKDHRYQAEDGRAHGDDGQAVHVGWRHRRLYQEVVVLGRLLHVNHSSAALGWHRCVLAYAATVSEWANLISDRGRMWW
jgi:hypothetical protein